MSIAIIISTIIALMFSILSLVTNSVRVNNLNRAMSAVGSKDEEQELLLKSNIEKFIHFSLNLQTVCIIYIAYIILSGNYDVY